MKVGFVLKKTRNGIGVFANISYKKESTLFEIKGKRITCYEDDDLDEKIRDNTYRFNEEQYISPEGEVANFVNHSCKPNAKVVKKNNVLFMVSITDIKKGEEVVFDYSTILASDDVWNMICNCGDISCRGLIKKFKSLPKQLKEIYISQHIVPDYIVRL